MNDLIDRAYRARRGSGLLDRLHGVGHLEDDRQERFTIAMSAYERATKQGDHVAAQQADEKIEALLAEARAERASQPPAEPETPAPVSFDGGVRGRRPVAPPGGGYIDTETGADLIRRGLFRRDTEHRERPRPQTIVVGS